MYVEQIPSLVAIVVSFLVGLRTYQHPLARACVSLSEVNGGGRNRALNPLIIKVVCINDQRLHLAVPAIQILSTLVYVCRIHLLGRQTGRFILVL